MTVDVLDYIGKYEGGVFVLLSLGFEDLFYEATFYYKENFVVLTVEEKLDEKLGCEIEDWSGYEQLMFDIIKRLVPYEEIINQVNDFKPEEYNLFLDKGDSETNDKPSNL